MRILRYFGKLVLVSVVVYQLQSDQQSSVFQKMRRKLRKVGLRMSKIRRWFKEGMPTQSDSLDWMTRPTANFLNRRVDSYLDRRWKKHHQNDTP